MQVRKEPTPMPLFQGSIYICDLCLNTGMTRTIKDVTVCPLGCSLQKNEASWLLFQSFARKSRIAEKDDQQIDFLAFDIARILTRFSSEKPCPRRRLEELFFELHGKENHGDTERKIKGYIETLRHDWLLPIGSRKSDPCGYWIITDLEDFKNWYSSVTQAPITLLSTIHKVAKHNFPVFAEQMELDFWTDLKPVEIEK